jgi:hypothetical protein
MTDTNTAQMVANLQANNSAIQAQGWVAPGLGRPNSALGFLNSGINPLSGLAAAGLSWFTPLVSFLGDGLSQLQGGDGASVSTGSQAFGSAGSDLGGLADTYRQSTTEQTSGWTGQAADDYRASAGQNADAVAGLGEGSNSTASAIVGAGQVVAQCIAEVTELIAEAVSQIVPIMTQAVARAGETNGESIAEAIPPCVAIAVEYALRIAAKLAALMASGDNLMKLVQGGMAIVELIQTAMQSISSQSIQPDGQAQALSAGPQQQGGGAGQNSETPKAAEDLAAWDQGNSGNSAPASSGGGSGGGSGMGAVSQTPTPNTDTSVDPGTHSSSVTPPVSSSLHSMPDTSRYVSHSSGSGSYGGGGSGGMGLGASALGGTAEGSRTAAPGSRTGVGRGAENERQQSRQQSSSRAAGSTGTTAGGMPMGGMAGAGAAGDKDKDHANKYVLEQDKGIFAPATPDSEVEVIEAEAPKK